MYPKTLFWLIKPLWLARAFQLLQSRGMLLVQICAPISKSVPGMNDMQHCAFAYRVSGTGSGDVSRGVFYW